MNEYGMPLLWAVGTVPTPEQLVEWFMSLTIQDKLKWMSRAQEDMEQGSKCFQMDHEFYIKQLESGLAKATEVMNDLYEKAQAAS